MAVFAGELGNRGRIIPRETATKLVVNQPIVQQAETVLYVASSTKQNDRVVRADHLVGRFKDTEIYRVYRSGRDDILQINQLVTKPLTEFFSTSNGGHRVGGGGTSKEAISRAKAKEKRQKSKKNSRK